MDEKCRHFLLPANPSRSILRPVCPCRSHGSEATSGRAAPFELHARCSAPLPGAPDGASPLLDLFATINRAFEEERARGYTINAHQPSESTARLDAAVRAAVAACWQRATPTGVGWRTSTPEHYVRHLVDENQNFEMM